MESANSYDVVLSETALQRIIAYKNALASSDIEAGAYLKNVIESKNITLDQISNERFIELLLLTKEPLIFAESQVQYDGSDWTVKEMELLGDLNVVMGADIFDNGVWSTSDRNFRTHNPPLKGTLLFTPGPLLESSRREATPDLKEVQTAGGNDIDQEKYNRLIDRRITPLFYYVNERAKAANRTALITIPGVGCGAFAGRFHGRMANHLNEALKNILRKHVHNFDRIACVYFDPHRELRDEQHNACNVKYRVRPSANGKNVGKSQLGEPKSYEEAGDDFSECQLFKIVAWDHVSFPGNDYFGGSRATDDGVSAAATNSMEIITGISGKYENGRYLPPSGKINWLKVVTDNGITLKANGNVKVITTDGKFMTLGDFEKENSNQHQLILN